MIGEDFISLADAAEIIGRSPVALRRAAELGNLEAVRVAGRWLTTREAAATYLAYVTQRAWLLEPQRRPGPKRGRGPRGRT